MQCVTQNKFYFYCPVAVGLRPCKPASALVSWWASGVSVKGEKREGRKDENLSSLRARGRTNLQNKNVHTPFFVIKRMRIKALSLFSSFFIFIVVLLNYFPLCFAPTKKFIQFAPFFSCSRVWPREGERGQPCVIWGPLLDELVPGGFCTLSQPQPLSMSAVFFMRFFPLPSFLFFLSSPSFY